MRRIFLILFGLIVLLGVLLARLPLGFVLEKAGLPERAVSYASAEGSIWNGRLNGLEAGGQPIGDVTLALRPQDLLRGGLGYALQWGGPGGRGAGDILVSPGAVSLSDVRLEQSLSSIEGLTNSVRAYGGTIRLRGGAIKLTSKSCKTAAGEISSDVLTRIGETYGRNFGPVSGTLRCEDGAIQIDLESSADTGDRVDVDASVWLDGRADLNAVVLTNDVELGAALAELQFERDEGVWRYSRINGMGDER